MIKNYLFFIFAFLSFSLTSCHENEEPIGPQEWPESNHTLLIYMIGDNTLTDYCKLNTQACINGILKTETPVNLVIYEDSQYGGKQGRPQLFRLKRNLNDLQKVDTIMIHQFDADHDSTDPAIMSSIIDEAFNACPGTVKGLELWSHGLGWAPSKKYTPTRSSSDATRSTQYIGEDNGSSLEIWDLRKALEKSAHLDYIAFDACNMGQAEVAFELRNAADYMLACPTEIMAQGLPYSDLIESLSACNSKETIVSALKSMIDRFAITYPGKVRDRFDTYVDGGTIGLYNLSKMTELRDAFRSLLSVCEDRRQLLQDHSYTYEDQIQPYGRTSAGCRYDFYDIMSYADFLVNDNPGNYPEYATLKEAINKVVLKEYHSEHVLDFKTMHSCGLGIGIPEIFLTTANNPNTLMSAYNELQWTKD